MARDTPRFGLDDYEVGDRGWDHSDLVQFVDTHSIDRGPVGDRPTQGTYPDELYLATDERVLYRWDADADTWLVAINVGFSEGDDFDGQGTSSFTNLESTGTERFDVTGWEWIDVTNHGADPTGTQDLAPVLNDLAADGRLLILPSGEYYMGEPFSFDGFSSFGIVGRGDVTITTDSNFDTSAASDMFLLGEPGDTDLRFGGFEIDFTATNTGYRVLDAAVDDGLLIENVRVNGRNDTATAGCVSVSVENPDGEGVVRRWQAPDGAVANDDGPSSPLGLYVHTSSSGRLWVESCHFEGWPDEGLYGKSEGPIHVRGGRWANNGGSQLRLAGAGSSARDVDVALDDLEKTPTDFGAPRLIWVRAPNVTLDNISATVDGQETLGITFTDDSAGSTLRDSSISLTCPAGVAIEVIDHTHDPETDARPVIQGVDIDAAYSDTERQCINLFSPVVLEDVTVDATDASNSVYAVEARDTGYVTVNGGTYVSDGRAIEFSRGESLREYCKIQSVARAESRDGVTDIRVLAAEAGWITDCTTVNGVESTGDYAGGASDYQRGNHTI